MVAALLILLLLAVVLAVISRPLLVARRSGADEEGVRAELEAAREAKYREIRDSELDFRTGKLSPQDYADTDAVLRREAMVILRRLEAISDSVAHDGDAPVPATSGEAEAIPDSSEGCGRGAPPGPTAPGAREPRPLPHPAAADPGRRNAGAQGRRRRAVRPPLDH